MPLRPPQAQVPRIKAPRVEKPRPSARKRGYDTPWEKARAGFLAKHPYCECPLHRGRAGAPRATHVDHIVPHNRNWDRFWDSSNWQAMSAGCHSHKTAKLDGGFGNRKRLPEDRIRAREPQ
jgi:5-methylcytosine-specific restriction protein A